MRQEQCCSRLRKPTLESEASRLGGRGGVGWGGGARRATKRIRRATEASNNQICELLGMCKRRSRATHRRRATRQTPN